MKKRLVLFFGVFFGVLLNGYANNVVVDSGEILEDSRINSKVLKVVHHPDRDNENLVIPLSDQKGVYVDSSNIESDEYFVNMYSESSPSVFFGEKFDASPLYCDSIYQFGVLAENHDFISFRIRVYDNNENDERDCVYEEKIDFSLNNGRVLYDKYGLEIWLQNVDSGIVISHRAKSAQYSCRVEIIDADGREIKAPYVLSFSPALSEELFVNQKSQETTLNSNDNVLAKVVDVVSTPFKWMNNIVDGVFSMLVPIKGVGCFELNDDYVWRSGAHALTMYAQEGNIGMVAEILRRGVHVDSVDTGMSGHDGRTPLIFAIQYSGSIEMVKFLLNKGANPNIQDKKSLTPIMYAAHLDNDAYVRLLLDKGANPNIRTKAHSNALMISLQFGKTSSCSLMLLGRISDIDAKDNEGHVVLTFAVVFDKPDLINPILRRKANPDIPDKNGWTALHHAADHGSVKIMKMLIKKGKADISKKTKDGETALDIAKRKGCNRCVSLLKNHVKGNIKKQLKEFFGSIVESDLPEKVKEKVDQLLDMVRIDPSDIDPKFAVSVVAETFKHGLIAHAGCEAIFASLSGVGFAFAGPFGAGGILGSGQLICSAASAAGAAAGGMKAGIEADNVCLMEGGESKGNSDPSTNQVDKFKKQLKQHGRESLEKSRGSIQKKLLEHKEKLKMYKKEGGYISSVEREIRNFENELEAINRVLGGKQ